MKQTIKIITSLIILAIAGFIIGGLITNKPETNPDLQRLEDISTRLAEIATKTHELRLQIEALEMQEADLNYESGALNDEAVAIFLKMVNVDSVADLPTDAEDTTESDIEDWYPGKLDPTESHQEMPELTGTTSHDRFKEMAQVYGLDASTIWKVEERYHLTEGMVLCITIAETSGGQRGYAQSNPGNVGNNDRGDRVTYALLESGLEAIGKTLTNQYLGGHTTLGCLSNAGSCREPNDNGKRYATSTNSREANVVACLSDIYEPINPETFLIRNR